MSTLQAGFIPDEFIKRIKMAQHRALLLDYDGTLAPFRVERDQAVPYEGVRERLISFIESGSTRVVIVSGRAIRDLEPLLRIQPYIEIWGSHGMERRLADGTYLGPEPLNKADVQALESARDWIIQLGITDQCEFKPVSLAVHWRGLAQSRVEDIRRSVVSGWKPLTERCGLELAPFDGGVEIIVPGKHKGGAVLTVLEEMDEDALVAYLGDDFTDEDAFEAIKGKGLGVLVRSEFRPTKAVAWLRPPEELLWFIDFWQ